MDDITFHYLTLMRHGIYNGNRNASEIEELSNTPLRQGDELTIDLISEKKMRNNTGGTGFHMKLIQKALSSQFSNGTFTIV